MFRYIEDKDVFQTFYSKLLARRLVHHLSASDDAEAQMISRLKVSKSVDDGFYIFILLSRESAGLTRSGIAFVSDFSG